MGNKLRRAVLGGLLAGAIGLSVLAIVTWWQVQPVLQDYRALASDMHRVQVLDRHGVPMNVTYQNRWNLHDVRALHEIPEFLQQAFLTAEDRRFQQHSGIDWAARLSALWMNIRHGRAVRGASTLSEQVVRMLHPRPRTLWSRWLEGWEAQALEAELSKPDILEFYLNQVPYGRNWRGVAQAARGYFNRDLETLNRKEMLALAVLVRAPSALDPWKKGSSSRLEEALQRLADDLRQRNILSPEERQRIQQEALTLEAPSLPVDASHFVRHLRLQENTGDQLRSTLDSGLQARVQSLLNERLKALTSKNLHNAAALVVDHQTGEVLAWVVAGDESTPGHDIDPVLLPRQPGSALKPFLYTAALEKGWSAATLIEDAPLQDAVGTGLHAFRNYSRHYYGPVSLREALGNSLNTPAVRTVQYVGVNAYMHILKQLGFVSLGDDSRKYDVGIALGNGEVTLFELVQAYSALARQGRLRPLRLRFEDDTERKEVEVFSAPAASLIGHILSDPYARQLEFGASSVLNLPVQTAAKTGTSTDYRDAWAVGYNYRYVVGIWMGNLDQKPTDGVTGSTGPSLALRAMFAELNRHAQTHRLPLNRQLVPQEICLPATGQDASADCIKRTEYFLPGHPWQEAALPPKTYKLDILRPTMGLQIAYDPRIPAELQAFRWEVSPLPEGTQIEWFLNGQREARTTSPQYLWPVTQGKYELLVIAHLPDGNVEKTGPVNFIVK